MIFDDKIASEISDILCEVKSIVLKTEGYFTWSSGWHSPIYCDNRKIVSHPEKRKLVTEGFKKLIEQKFPETDCIVGVATAGIPHGAFLAYDMNLPFAYVRSKPKAHGMQNKVEGEIQFNQKVLVIEDLISTGKSSIDVAKFLMNEGYDVLGIVAIFNYGFETANKAFAELGKPFYTLTNYMTLINKLEIATNERDKLKDWRLNPAEWNK